MKDYEKKLSEYGLGIPEILLPAEGTDMSKWAVVACDQYTSQKDYWRQAAEYIAGSPSTLNLIFPECYLEDEGSGERIISINNCMEDYLSRNILESTGRCFVLVKRETPSSAPRWGLVAALDLEYYDYSRESTSLIRATEGTIIERLPPRKRIRKNASVELPHIMVLLDDPQRSLIEPLRDKTSELKKLYDFELMAGSGHLTGYKVDNPELLEAFADALELLGSEKAFIDKYGTEKGILYAMGDGNHSLATAKSIWEDFKQENKDNPEVMNHPSRWALVELANIFDDGIEFEAIHRILTGCDTGGFFSAMESSGDFRMEPCSGLDEVLERLETSETPHICGFRSGENFGLIRILNPVSSVAAGTVQAFIDNWIAGNKGSSVDYIHGTDVASALAEKDGAIAFFLPPIPKDSFFKTVVADGAFPRKTFSMGEAFEKRFYVEARKIR